MADSLEVSEQFAVSAEELYRAWLDSDRHSAFTGTESVIDPQVGGAFSAGDGYISGRTEELHPYSRIVQSWRTTDFPASSPDSRLELLFEEVQGGTRLTLRHSNIPDGQGPGYEQGWKDYYFRPMKKHFG